MRPLSAPSATRRLWAAAAGVVLVAGLQPSQAGAAPTPGIGSATGATAATERNGEQLSDYDARKAVGLRSSGAAQRAALVAKPAGAVRKLRDQLGVQGIVEIDPATGTPRRVAKLNGFLTAASKAKPADIAKSYVTAHPDVFGLSPAVVAGLQLRKDYVDVAGTHHLSFVQSVGGVPVFGNGLKAHVAKDGRLIQLDGSPLPALPAAAGAARLSAAKARTMAVADVFGDSTAKVTKAAVGATRTTTFADGGKAQLVLFQTARGPRLAWQTVTVDEGYVHVVDDASGELLYRRNTRQHDSAQVFPNYPGAPVGGSQVSVNLTKWLPENSPRLAGYVAHVYSDVNDDNAANPTEEVKLKAGNFNFPFVDFSKQVGPPCAPANKCSWNPKVPNSWQVNRAQNATQLFYFLGTFHDHLAAAPIGFTRAAGNFEAVDDDAVQGQAMDGANTANGLPDGGHVNNANMSTPPDGTPPIMQMYLFHDPSDPSDPFIAGNSGDESDIVYHEYTHGLSNRLVVGADGNSTLGNVQAGSMGEAWSDWYAMDYLVNVGLEKDTAAIGDLKLGKYVGAGGGVLRSEPMDCPVGTTAAACGGTPGAGPGGYTYGDFGRVANGPEVHADGEIWGQTLWDLRKVLGSKRTESVVTRAMELSPANPSFLDERNSILQADLVVNKGANQAKIWQVFAKRGMGYFAGAVDGDDAQTVEDFSLPPAADTPRGTLAGAVSDVDTGAVMAGVVVGFGGHASGFGGDLVATTGADGKYVITGILPGTYPKVFAKSAGYDTPEKTVSVASRTNVVNWQLRRDWAAAGGGGQIVDFNGPDYNDQGCGPAQLIDQSQGSSWRADDITFDDAGTMSSRFVIVRLPVGVDVTEIAINPKSGCGLGGSASTGDYRLETSVDGSTWTLASQGHFGVADRVMHPVSLAPGSTAGVQFVRYTELGTQVAEAGGKCPDPGFSGCSAVASTELGVYGKQH